MPTATKDTPRNYLYGDVSDLPVTGTETIFEGSAVGDNSVGNTRPLVAGDPFRGFCVQHADNSTGAAGDVYVKVKREGFVQLPITGLALSDQGKDVYASDDITFTLTQGSNTRIGYVAAYLSAGVGIVKFSANSGVNTELTDGSTGTASDSIAAITDVPTKNAIASLAAKVNYLIRCLGV